MQRGPPRMHACSHSRLPLCVLSLCLQAIDHHVFMKVRAKTLTLAFPGMALGSFIMGCFVKIFYQRWGWDLCLILGVITSATDPVAVVALLRERESVALYHDRGHATE